VWLIEVNTNPYFGVVNSDLPGFIDGVVDETLRLTLDTYIEPKEINEEEVSNYRLLYSEQ